MAFSLPPEDLSYSSTHSAACLIPIQFILDNLTAKSSNEEDYNLSKKYFKQTTK